MSRVMAASYLSSVRSTNNPMSELYANYNIRKILRKFSRKPAFSWKSFDGKSQNWIIFSASSAFVFLGLLIVIILYPIPETPVFEQPSVSTKGVPRRRSPVNQESTESLASISDPPDFSLIDSYISAVSGNVAKINGEIENQLINDIDDEQKRSAKQRRTILEERRLQQAAAEKARLAQVAESQEAEICAAITRKIDSSETLERQTQLLKERKQLGC